MTAQPALYPASLPLWLDKRDNLDLVEAAHVNRLQIELDATQRALGTGISVTKDASRAWYPHGGSGPASGNFFWAYTGASNDQKWLTLNDRLTNVERAALRDLDYNYLSLFGGATITPGNNVNRPANTGGIAVSLPSTDAQPAVAVVNNVGGNWAQNAVVSLWADGTIRGAILRLKSSSTVNTAVVDPDNGFTVGRVSMGPDKVDVGTAIRMKTDANVDGHQLMVLRPPVNPNGDTMFLQAEGGIRNVLRIKDAAGGVVFLLDSDGNLTCNTLKILKDPTDRNNLYLNGVHLHRGGLHFTNTQWGTGLGGSYRPDGLSFSGGGGMSGGQVTLNNNQRIYANGAGIGISGQVTNFEGGILVNGMASQLYHVSGTMFIPIPQKPGGPQGSYEPPCRTTSKTNRRDVRMGFDGPTTGRVKISWSVEIRAYSRPVYVSFGIQDMATGGWVVSPSDDHACVNNGARAAGEQSDVDHVTTASFAVVGGLVPGRPYNLVVFTRAADTGAGDVGKTWTQANNARFMIEPVLTSFGFGVVSG